MTSSCRGSIKAGVAAGVWEENSDSLYACLLLECSGEKGGIRPKVVMG